MNATTTAAPTPAPSLTTEALNMSDMSGLFAVHGGVDAGIALGEVQIILCSAYDLARTCSTNSSSDEFTGLQYLIKMALSIVESLYQATETEAAQ